MQSNEDMDAIVKACSDAGVQLMDGVLLFTMSLLLLGTQNFATQ